MQNVFIWRGGDLIEWHLMGEDADELQPYLPNLGKGIQVYSKKVRKKKSSGHPDLPGKSQFCCILF